MSRINNNVTSLIAQRILRDNNLNLSQSLERLSTGFRINRGGDDPAGLIASEKLRAEKTALSAAIGNAERADQIANIMEGGLQEISSLLQEVQGLIGQNGSETGLSTEEKEANQFQVDQIIQTIDRIASTTTFNGVKLLNGSQDFQVQTGDEVRNIRFVLREIGIGATHLRHPEEPQAPLRSSENALVNQAAKAKCSLQRRRAARSIIVSRGSGMTEVGDDDHLLIGLAGETRLHHLHRPIVEAADHVRPHAERR